jgi:hypothetical protein
MELLPVPVPTGNGTGRNQTAQTNRVSMVMGMSSGFELVDMWDT